MTNEELVSLIQQDIDRESNLTQLYTQNTGILRKYALQFFREGQQFEMDDLLQEAWIGMQTAIPKYDPEAGVKFVTYATWWIRQGLARYVQNYGSSIRFPVHLQEKLPRYQAYIDQYRSEHGADPDRQTVANALKVSMETVRYFERYIASQSMRSFDEPITDEGHTERILADVVPDDQNMEENILDNMLSEDLRNQIRDILTGLKENQRIALIETVMNGRTLKEISTQLHLSPARIQQLRKRALNAVKEDPRYERLQDTAFVYGISSRAIGVILFRQTSTSATERAALMDIDRKERFYNLLRNVAGKKLNVPELKQLLNNLDDDSKRLLIETAVPDLDDRRTLVLRFIEQRSSKEIFPAVCRRTAYRWIDKILLQMVDNLNEMALNSSEIQPESDRSDITIPNN